MTNELEKQFFNTFNIEPIGCNDNKNCTGILDCTQCPNAKYPQITNRILLELRCIYNQYSHYFSIYGEKKEFLRDDILEFMINILNYFYAHEMEKYSKLKRQVRTLFEEG